MIEQLFHVARRKAGFPDDDRDPVPATFRRPGVEQGALF
jgi:hypothetical protein